MNKEIGHSRWRNGKDVIVKRGKEGFVEAQTIVAGEESFPT